MITPELAQVIALAIEDRLIDVHTALPGAVQKYDPLTQTADIELQVKRMLPKTGGGFVTEALPVLPNVPVSFQRGGGFFLSFPLSPGDTGLVVFAETSIDQWRAKDAVSSPGEVGRHTLTAGVFIPGLAATSRALTTVLTGGAVFGAENGVQLRSKGDTLEAVTYPATSAADFVALAAKVDQFIAALDGFLTSLTIPAGGAAVGPLWLTEKLKVEEYLPDGVIPSTASSNLKAD